MKVAIIASFPMLPPHGGNRARLKSLFETLQDEGHEPHLIMLPPARWEFDAEAHRQLLGERLHILKRTRLGRWGYLIRRAANEASRRLRSGTLKSSQRLNSVDEIYYSGYEAELRQLHEKYRFDAVIAHYVTMSKSLGVFAPPVLKVLDTHDSMTHFMDASEERKGLLRADVVWATQKDEAQTFMGLMKPHEDRVLVQAHKIPSSAPLKLEKTLGASFLGSSFEANIESARYFINEIMPLVQVRIPEFKFFLSGTICADIEDNPSVLKLGRVESVRDAFLDAPILVNSIIKGTGLKIKLIETMALGLPVVSTEMGVRGLGTEYLQGVIVTPDGAPQDFADAVVQLMENPSLRFKLGANAVGAAQLWNKTQVEALRETLGRSPERAS